MNSTPHFKPTLYTLTQHSLCRSVKCNIKSKVIAQFQFEGVITKRKQTQLNIRY